MDFKFGPRRATYVDISEELKNADARSMGAISRIKPDRSAIGSLENENR